MSPVRKYSLRVARRWVLVVALAAAGGVLAAVWSVTAATTTWTATAALTSQSQERSPDQDGVLSLGYVDYFNQDSYQQLLRAQAGIPDDVELSAQVGASSPILYIQASGSSEGAVRDAAATATEVFREDVRESLVTQRRQAVDDLQAEIDANVQLLNSLERTDVEKNVILDQIRSLQGRLTEFLADNTNHLKPLQAEPGVTSSTPSPLLGIVGGMAGGALVGILIALVMSMFDRRQYTAEEIREATGLPVLAELGPERDPERRTRLRNLLNSLSATRDGTAPVIAIACVRRSRGASVLAYELVNAWSARRGGALHVMADLRAPAPGYERMHGLADVLQGRASVLDAAVTLAGGARVLPPGDVAGVDPYTVAEPLQLARVLEEASRNAGLVVLEAPPVLDAPESQSVCAVADQVVLVVDGMRTPSDELREAIDLLHAVNARIAGIVVDRVGGGLPAGPARPVVEPAPDTPVLVPAARDGHGAEAESHEAESGEPEEADATSDGVAGSGDGHDAENGDGHDDGTGNGGGDTVPGRRPSPYPRDAVAAAASGERSNGSRDGQWQG
jgi:Mrp family chromosome partitioning ATPase/capsular polysaccharide biosynthesis protein